MRRTRKTRKAPKTRRRSRSQRRQGGSHFLEEAIRIAKEATAMDPSHVFALAGSTAVHLYLQELLTHPLDLADKEEAERLLETLAAPDDLDFKYKRNGPLFANHVVEKPRQLPNTSRGLTLNLSAFLEEPNLESCLSYVDLAGFRCCDPYEESPIFHKLPGTTSAFSKLEFHAPKEFRRKPMETVEIRGIPVLSINTMLELYGRYEVSANQAKMAALAFVASIFEKYSSHRS